MVVTYRTEMAAKLACVDRQYQEKTWFVRNVQEVACRQGNQATGRVVDVFVLNAERAIAFVGEKSLLFQILLVLPKITNPRPK